MDKTFALHTLYVMEHDVIGAPLEPKCVMRLVATDRLAAVVRDVDVGEKLSAAFSAGTGEISSSHENDPQPAHHHSHSLEPTTCGQSSSSFKYAMHPDRYARWR